MLYLTYEELKPIWIMDFSCPESLLYLTYEELKQIFKVSSSGSNVLYLTYEELKPSIAAYSLALLFCCTLPMRN